MEFYDRFSVTSAAIDNPAQYALADGDFNGDGYRDVFYRQSSNAGVLNRPVLVISNPSGDYSVRYDALPGDVAFEDPIAVTGDFNADGHLDLAVFDAGNYNWSIRAGIGHPPVLLLGNGQGGFTRSDALALAVLNAPKDSYLGNYATADLHIKDVTAADIDMDGDLDLWVESTGGLNITNHFMINDGGTFRVDPTRIARATLFGSGSKDFWRYGTGELKDLNGDGAPDLILGQIRDNDPSHLNQSSYVVYNDGRGYFPLENRVALPLPGFYHGYTAVTAIAAADLNGDGLRDLVLSHTRNDDVSGPETETPWVGRYLQVLYGRPDGKFADVTDAVLGDQAASVNPGNGQSNSAHDIDFFDVNGDGRLDIVLSLFWDRPATYAPVVLLANANGTFRAVDAQLWQKDAWWGEYPLLRDINGDGLLDMVHVDPQPGANGIYEGRGDDTGIFEAQTAKAGVDGFPAAAGVRGTSGNDVINLSRGSSEAWGFAGNDRIVGTGEDEWIDGGIGTDLVALHDVRANYHVAMSSAVLTVADTHGKDGIDTLINIERLWFTDGTLAFDTTGNAGQAYRLYQAAFDRKPDVSGLGYWIRQLDDGKGDLAWVANNFIISEEFKTKYGTPATVSNSSFLDLLYQNVLHRAPDTSGKAYWMDQLDHGFARERVLASFSESTENQGNVATAIADGIWYV